MPRQDSIVADAESELVQIRGVRFALEGRKREATEITRPQQLARFVRKIVGSDPREHFIAVYLDGRHVAIGYRVVSVGTMTASLVHPREIFTGAIWTHASALLLAHNHPSGNPRPSAADREVTKRLRKAGEILGIRLLDHLIVCEASFHSFAESGELES